MDAMNDGKQTAKAAIFNTIVNFLVMAVGTITVPIVTRIMPTYDVGVANTFFSTRNTMVILASLAAYSYVNKAMLEFRQEKKDVLYTLVLFCACSTAVVFAACLFFKELLQSLLSLNDFLFVWLFISSFCMTMYYVAYYYCAFHNKILLSSMIIAFNGIVAPAISIMLIVSHDNEYYKWRILGLDFSLLAISVVLVVWLITCSTRKIKTVYLSRMLSFSIPLIPNQLSTIILTQCDLIMISYLVGQSESGIYSMGHLVGFLASVAVTQIFNVWSPWVYRRFEADEEKTVYEYSKFIILIAAFFAFGLITIAPELIYVFLPEDYSDCIYIVPVLVAAMFLQSMSIFFYDIMYYNKKTWVIAGISGFAAVLNLILNYIFISKYGYLAACYTTYVSYMLMLLGGCVYTLWKGAARIYNLRLMLLVCILISVYAWATMLVFSNIVSRYAIFLIFTVVLFLKYYKNALQIIRAIRN